MGGFGCRLHSRQELGGEVRAGGGGEGEESSGWLVRSHNPDVRELRRGPEMLRDRC